MASLLRVIIVPLLPPIAITATWAVAYFWVLDLITIAAFKEAVDIAQRLGAATDNAEIEKLRAELKEKELRYGGCRCVMAVDTIRNYFSCLSCRALASSLRQADCAARYNRFYA